MGHDSEVNRLLEILKNTSMNDVDMSSEVISSLLAFNEDAFQTLLKALDDNDINVRRAAMIGIAFFVDVRAIRPLTKLALNESDKERRNTALWALNQINNLAGNSIGSGHLDIAIEGLKSDSAEIKQQSLIILSIYRDKDSVKLIGDCLDDSQVDIKRLAINVLGHIATIEAEMLLLKTLVMESNKELRQTAGGYLSETRNSGIINLLIDKLGDTTVISRVEIATVLGNIRDKRASDALMAVLANENRDLVRAAMVALGKIHEMRALEYLLQSLNRKGMQDSAIEALGYLQSENAVDALIPFVQDDDWQREAAWALAAIGGAKAAQTLVGFLGSEDHQVRESAIITIKNLGRPAISLLIAALDDKDEAIREYASELLDTFSDDIESFM